MESTVVRVGAVKVVATVTICCDDNVDTWWHFSHARSWVYVEHNTSSRRSVFLSHRVLQARARQKGWINVRIFGSMES